MTDHKDETPRQTVALQYTGKGAPRVTAKGAGEVAERILELARENDIPVQEDSALAALLATVPLGDEIPEALYIAVAEVLAFAYYLSGKTPEGLSGTTPEGMR